MADKNESPEQRAARRRREHERSLDRKAAKREQLRRARAESDRRPPEPV